MNKFDEQFFDGLKSVDYYTISSIAASLTSYSGGLFDDLREGKIQWVEIEQEVYRLGFRVSILEQTIQDFMSENPGSTDEGNMNEMLGDLYWNIAMLWYLRGNTSTTALENANSALGKFLFCSLLANDPSETEVFDSLYKFCSCSQYSFENCSKEQVTLVGPQKFNDPFDCPVRAYLQIDTSESIHEDLTVDEVFRKEAQKIYEKLVRVTCFASGVYDDTNIFLNPLMWAHYADSHKGFCVKYNYSAIKESIKEYNKSVGRHKFASLQRVYYTDELLQYSDCWDIKWPNAEMFFRKGLSWKYEGEVRLVAVDTEGREEYPTLKVENCVEEVFLGFSCSQENENKLREIFRSKKCRKKKEDGSFEEVEVKFYRIKQGENFGEFKLEEC